MTADEQNKLNDLQAAYDLALKNYNQEENDNYTWHQGWIQAGNTDGGVYQGKTNQQWTTGKDSSDASLALKGTILKQAKANLDDFNASLTQNALNALATSNPVLYTQAVTAKATADAQAQSDAAKAAAAADVTKTQAAFASATTKYYIIGAAVIVIVIGVIVYLKSRKSKKIPA
jgi:hypothetical protein